MKQLILVRHGKSDWMQPGQDDFERGLIEKGIVRTEMIGRHLAGMKLEPGLIVSSPAVRAAKTAGILADILNYPQSSIVFERSFYQADARLLLDFVLDTDDSYGSLMLVGHNPEMSQLANMLGNSDIGLLPTTGTVGIRFHTGQWKKIRTAGKDIMFILFPKALSHFSGH